MKNLDRVESRYGDYAGLLRSYTVGFSGFLCTTTLGVVDISLEGVNLNI